MAQPSDPAAAGVLISLHPRYADAMAAGLKTIELRRRFPMLPPGTPILIYATLPLGQLYGWATVVEVHARPISQLWEQYRDRVAVNNDEFSRYFDGREVGYAVEIEGFQRLQEPLDLDLCGLRAQVPQFQPPQSYRYLRPEAPRQESRKGIGEWLVELCIDEFKRSWAGAPTPAFAAG